MNSRLRRFLCLLLSAVLLFGALPAAEVFAAETVTIRSGIDRVYGRDRYDTGFAIADAWKQVQGVDSFDTVVIACGTNFADALSGSYLANKRNAPILLVGKNNVDSVKDYLYRNLTPGGTVYILGGTSAVPAEMEEGMGMYYVERLAGKTRYETNLAILREAGTAGEDVLVCTGKNFADALSAAAVCKPILMVGDELNDVQRNFLAGVSGNLIIIGGTGAVSAGIEEELWNYGDTERVKGASRFETSVLVAERFFDDPSQAVLAYAMNFPDGLCGGALAYAMGAPIILTQTDNEDAAIAYAEENEIFGGVVLGGSSLISDNAAKKIFGVAYAVTFDTAGGTEIEPQFVRAGAAVTRPEDPQLDGYYLENWYTDEALTQVYDFSTPVSDDMTLYACWRAGEPVYRNEYYVTFLTNDEQEIAYQTQTVYAGGYAARPADPARDGYTFGGWYTDEACSEEYNFADAVNHDMVLFAGWKNPDGTDNSLYHSSSGGCTEASISGLAMNDDRSQVITTINIDHTAILYVEFIDESGYVLADYAVQTPTYCELTPVPIDVDCYLPDYFLIRATLFEKTGEQACDPYTAIEYTSAYAEFEERDADYYEAQGERVLRFSTQTGETNFGVLEEGILEIEASDDTNLATLEMIETEDSTSDNVQWNEVYTITNPDETVTNLVEGQVIAIPNTEGSTYLLKIGNIEVDEAENVVTIIPANDATLEEFYQVLKVDMAILVEDEEESGESGTTPGGRAPTVDAELFDISVCPSVSLGGDIEWKLTDAVSVTGSLTGTGKVNVKLKYDAHLFGKDYFSCSVVSELNLTLDIGVSVGIDDDPDFAQYIDKEMKLPSVNVPTPVPGLTAFFKVTIPLEWEMSAGCHFKLVSETKSGFKYDTTNGKQKVDEKSRTYSLGLEGKAEMKFGPKISLGLKYLVNVVEASVNVWAGINLAAETEIGIESTDAPSVHACGLCISGTAKWFVEVTAKLKFCIIEDILEATPINATLFSVDGWIKFLKSAPGEFYLSLINGADSQFGGRPHFGGGECPNEKYRVTIESEDADGNATTGVPVTLSKQNGDSAGSGSTTMYKYLYDGVYTASATIDRTRVVKSFVVSGDPTTVVIAPSAADGKLNGKIVDADTNSPISGASITISKDGFTFSSCTSNGSGNYTANLPAGTYKVSVTKSGYVPYSTYVEVAEGATRYLETAMLVNGENQYMGGFSGTITDAVTGYSVSDVYLEIFKGCNNTNEADYVGSLTSDYYGYFEYETIDVMGIVFGLPAGNYTVRASKDGYITNTFNVVVVAGETRGYQDATISPEMDDSEFRIVLRWGEYPWDLDSHYNGVTVDGYRDHVCYYNTWGTTANLDTDDTYSYGPETVTVTDFEYLKNGFTYSVHDYTNRYESSSTAMSNSGAYIELFRGGTLLRTFYIPTGKIGTVWNVFSMDSSGNIRDLNTFENISEPDYVGIGYTGGAYSPHTFTDAAKQKTAEVK